MMERFCFGQACCLGNALFFLSGLGWRSINVVGQSSCFNSTFSTPSRLFSSERNIYLNLRHSYSTHMDITFWKRFCEPKLSLAARAYISWYSTVSILSTCLITLGLCAWLAIQLNIASRQERP